MPAVKAAETFVFLCPICHERSEHERGQERKRSHCPHCQAAVVLLELNGHSERSATVAASEQGPSFRDAFPGLAWLGQLVVEIVFLPLTLLAWLISLLLKPVSYLLNKAKLKYHAEGWRGLSRFRLSHFLIAVTLLAIAMAYYGPRYAQEWKLQGEAEQFYQSKLALADERESLQRTLTSIGSAAVWRSEDIPQRYDRALRGRNRTVFETQALIRLFGHRSNMVPPNQWQWQAALTEICEYPEVIQLSFYSTTIDGSVFESLRASESVQEVSINGDTFPLEGYQWCARCPNLESLSASRYGWPRAEGADDAVLEALCQSPSLTSLSLSYVDLTAEGLAALRGLENLRVLHLKTRRPLDSEAIAQVASLPLEELSLVSQPISDDAIAKLCEVAKTQTLYLGSGMVSEGQLRQLQDAAIVVRSYGNNPSERAFAPP